MTVVKISHEVPADAVARVRSLLDLVEMREPSFNGADIRIERDDFTCVECDDQIAGADLLQRVYAAIDGLDQLATE